MFLQPIAEHAVMPLTCFSCPSDPEAEIKTKIQKNLKTKKKKKKGQSESYMLQAGSSHFGDYCTSKKNTVFQFVITRLINY